MGRDFIRIGGAREHNLKNLTLSIPRDKLVVITGLSGSGKSSLAFDTIYAEGQRKYVESLSAYARQFLDKLQKPDVDYIEGLSPAIAIEQRGSGSNPRSIIATTTEIYDYLRLLFANVGQPHCPASGKPIFSQTTTQIVDAVMDQPEKTRCMILAPVVTGSKGEFRDVLEKLTSEGFVRVRIDGEILELGGNERIKLDAKKSHAIEAVVDRLVIDEKIRARVGDSVETALRRGEGGLIVLRQLPGAGSDRPWDELKFSNRLVSPTTGASFDPPTIRHFSFNSPSGACKVCHGLGQKMVFDESLVVPDPEKTLEKGAVLAWRRGGKRMVSYYKGLLKGMVAHYGQSMEVPFKKLSEDFRRKLIHGTGGEEVKFSFWRAGKAGSITRPFEGVVPNLARLWQESKSEFTRKRLKAFMSPSFCDACHGRRLRPEILSVTLGSDGLAKEWWSRRLNDVVPGLSIMDVCEMSVSDVDRFLESLELTGVQLKIAGDVLKEIRSRLGFLINVGLGYLTLNRESGTLSGGEAQRIRLATQIGAGLTGVLYILDEPSIGLHQRDNDRLLETLDSLRDAGNSVIVVEHDEDTIRRADHVLDIGPGAGIHGGEVIASGTVEDVMECRRSLTAQYLNGNLSVEVPKKREMPSPDRGWIEILGAEENNLKNIDVQIPIGTITCVTGVSGSGKSTLVDDILRRSLFRQWYGSKDRPGKCREIRGTEPIEKIIVIDQSPIGRTPRSNPATFTGMFNHIRDLFSKLPAARVRGFSAGRFSFNMKGGRCEACQGDGLIKIEMHFLPPVYVTCEACAGRRYNRATLEIAYKGQNIADVLDMSVEEAVTFFRAVPQIYDRCQMLAEVGLGYLRLGQSATTLSGGEAQRLKLGAELSKKSGGRTLYILDEPTTGLHFHDVAKLLEVLFKLRNLRNTLVVIEHNLDVIKTADWVIDLGPGGGADGGNLVVAGTPETVAKCRKSHTGRYLKKYLAKR